MGNSPPTFPNLGSVAVPADLPIHSYGIAEDSHLASFEIHRYKIPRFSGEVKGENFNLFIRSPCNSWGQNLLLQGAEPEDLLSLGFA
jgi:hypothetical protein